MARADHPESSSSKPESPSKPESSSIYVGLVCTQATACMQNLQQTCRQKLGLMTLQHILNAEMAMLATVSMIRQARRWAGMGSCGDLWPPWARWA